MTNGKNANYLILLSTILISLLTIGSIINNNTYSQQKETITTNNATNASDIDSAINLEHQIHELHDLITSESIPLQGQLDSGDYLLLMDLTPFATSVETHSHIALKVPCDENGQSHVTVVTGIAPKLNTLDTGTAINNATLDGNPLDLSNEGKSCLYHAELPRGITDIALVNTNNQTLSFDGGGYSVAITIHGTAIEHID